MNLLSRSAFVGLALSLCHCASADSPEDPVEQTSQGVCATPLPNVGGTEVREHRAIGLLFNSSNSYCTGTLLRSRIVLTAAHCIDTSKPADYTFVMDGVTTKYTTDRAHNFGQWSANNEPGWRTGDIAIVRLTQAIPSRLALPLGLAKQWPAKGATLTTYGYGCNDRATKAGGGVKRKLSFPFNGTPGASGRQDLCPGDSGGPLFDTARGVIVGTNSGYINSLDYYGDVPKYYQAIFDKMGEWGVTQ